MSTEAAVTQSVPSLLYAQQPRPMDSEADAPIRRFEDEKRLIKDAEGILQQFIDQNLLIPEEYGNTLSSFPNLVIFLITCPPMLNIHWSSFLLHLLVVN